MYDCFLTKKETVKVKLQAVLSTGLVFKIKVMKNILANEIYEK